MDTILITNIVYGILISYFIIEFFKAIIDILYKFFIKILINRKLKKQLDEIKGAEVND